MVFEETSSTQAQSVSDAGCVLRGSHRLCTDELRAHLAALLRLENVGVLLGAGASTGTLGGMTMNGLWNSFETEYAESKKWLKESGFISETTGINVENLIDALEVARLEWTRSNQTQMLQQLESVRANVLRVVIHASILQSAWWKNPSVIEADPKKLANHRQLLHKLTASRQPGQPSPWVFTTNYDLAVEWAAETIGLKVNNGFDGLHRRTFSPHNFDLSYRNTLARGEARFGTYGIHLAKLHGSLTWYLDQEGTIIEHSTSYLWPQIETFLAGTNNEIPGYIVYPSSGKYLQTAGFVLGELIRRFTEFLARPQSCLIISGFSFSDEHLNRVLSYALRNPTLQMVVCLPDVYCEDESLNFEDCSEWFKRLAELESPQVTIIGGKQAAYFETLIENLPDPAIYDEQSERIREMIKKHREWKASTFKEKIPGGDA